MMAPSHRTNSVTSLSFCGTVFWVSLGLYSLIIAMTLFMWGFLFGCDSSFLPGPVHALFPFFSLETVSPLILGGTQSYTGIIFRSLHNFLLFHIVFGIPHTLFAQKWFQTQSGFSELVPKQAMRMFFLFITAVCSILVVGLWQRSPGVYVWRTGASEPTPTPPLLEDLIVFGLMNMVLLHNLWQFNPLVFIGLWSFLQPSKKTDNTTAAKRSDATPSVINTGFFRFVRHPIYCATMFGAFITPAMGIDRFTLGMAMATYLMWAVPVEEEKLIATFGEEYERYRKQVPAKVIPCIF
eukprot:TRINITY_DN5892_c0_g1_i1.p1 TRINITY_DN5892_c0_g1~~TRINITY_DN5892_c0_g1_i1.p1  ORF type:complete len:295 (+),score=16.89 TRINITY_DN5892_c0_g1_i1:284-1168(+)